MQRLILAALAVAAQGADVPNNAPMKIDGDTAGGVLQQSSPASLVAASVAREATSVEKATKRASATVAVNKPNVLLVLVDDQGHGDIDLGVGKAEFHTPTLSALASEGVRLSNFYSGATCTPSRAMLMTGRYAMRYGFQDSVIHATEPRGVPLTETFLSDKLQKVGYTTAMIGKWHLGMHMDAYVPLSRGFDLHYGILTGGGSHTKHVSVSQKVQARGQEDSHTFSGANLWDNGAFAVDNQPGEHSTTLYTRRTMQTIAHLEAADAKAPWFVFLSFQAVHDPIEVGDETFITGTKCNAIAAELATRRTLCGMMAEVDDGLGQIKTQLLAAKAWDRTVIVYASDNGGLMSHGSSNMPFSGEKGMYFEGGVHVPAFFGGGFMTAALAAAGGTAGLQLANLAHLTDLHVTIATLGGVDLTEDAAVSGTILDGVDLWPQLTVPAKDAAAAAVAAAGVPGARTEVLINVNSENFGNSAALRVGDYKLLVNPNPQEATIYMKVKAHLQASPTELSADDVAAVALQMTHVVVDGKKFIFNLAKNPAELDSYPDSCRDVEACGNLVGVAGYEQLQTDLEARLTALRLAAAPPSFAWQDDGVLANPQLFNNLWAPWRDANGHPKVVYQGLASAGADADASPGAALAGFAAAAGSRREAGADGPTPASVLTALVGGGGLVALVAAVAFKAGAAASERKYDLV